MDAERLEGSGTLIGRELLALVDAGRNRESELETGRPEGVNTGVA